MGIPYPIDHIRVVLTPNVNAPQPAGDAAFLQVKEAQHLSALLYTGMFNVMHQSPLQRIWTDATPQSCYARASHRLQLDEMGLMCDVVAQVNKPQVSADRTIPQLDVHLKFTHLVAKPLAMEYWEPEDYLNLTLSLKQAGDEWVINDVFTQVVMEREVFFTTRQLAVILEWLHRSFNTGIFSLSDDNHITDTVAALKRMVESGQDNRLPPLNWRVVDQAID